MAADAGISQQYMQPVRSVADYAGDMDKQEQNALTLAASRMKGQQDQQTMQDSQTARQLAQGYGGDMNALSQAYMKAGLIPQAQALQKSILESDTSRADVSKVRAEAIDKQLGEFRSFVPQINSPEAAGQYAAAMYDHPELGKLASQFGSREDVIKRNMESFAKDPRSWMVNSAGVTADKLLSSLEGKRHNINAGGSSIGQTTDYYGEVVPGQTTVTPITQSADNAATVSQSASNARLTDSRARDLNATRVEENTLKREVKNDSMNLTKQSQLASFDTMLGTLDRLGKHPGLSRSVGITGAFPTMPGSDSANFQAELNTFQSQAFIPMVAQLKGMGALSDAEGKKLTAAVGALDPKMGEQAFRDSVQRITQDMDAARMRVSGGQPKPQPAQPGAVARVTNNEDYARLPSGTTYTDPNGQMRTKK